MIVNPLLGEWQNVLACPYAPFSLDGRETEGLIWDPATQTIINQALPTIRAHPPRETLHVDEAAVVAEARKAWSEAPTHGAPAIFGGSLIRHFGHFLHESLGRLWWLAPIEGMEASAREAALQLQGMDAEVVFFMPKWLDQGKELLPYMEDILHLLRLPPARIRILQAPLRLQQLWVPACVWGFSSDARALDLSLGCDTRALMRHLLANTAVPAPPRRAAPAPARKVYVTRSGLPIDLGRLIGDVVLDPLLAEAGYALFHPERCSISEQIRVYSQAEDLIFMDGSAVYVLWLCRLCPGTRVRVILRRKEGRWMWAKVQELLPEAAQIRWEVVDGLKSEALTSAKDWESHNLADLAGLLRLLGLPVPASLPPTAHEALAAYSQSLVQQGNPDQLAQVIQAMLTTLATAPQKTPSRRTRLYRRLRRWLAERIG